MGNAFRAGAVGRLLAFLDIGRRPDGVKRLVEPEAGIDVTREFIRLGDDGFQGCANERVAVGLAASESAGVTPQEWQMRRKLLSKRDGVRIS